jgi:hypothetical protein
MKINAIQCPNCKDIVYSRAKYDKRFCGCGDVAIEGGFDYRKISFRGMSPTSLEIDVDIDKVTLANDYSSKANKYGLLKDNSQKELKRFVFE